jgi:hypothetical protein
MMIKTAVQVWDAALATRPGHLIDKFLDWIEELSNTMVAAQPDTPALIEVRIEARRDR